MKKITLLLLVTIFSISGIQAQQHSIARQWNEILLEAIRNDFSRPTVHSRNLFHTSMAMYDAWAIFDDTAETVFLGKTFGDYDCNFTGIANPSDVNAARQEIISYAMYRILKERFASSPGFNETSLLIENLFTSLGYDKNYTSKNYSSGSYAALGNYLASEIINFGMLDGSNNQNDYESQYYNTVNDPLILNRYDDNTDIDPNRWQPLAFDSFQDQSGNIYADKIPDFLGPEWGTVRAFCLQPEDLEVFNDRGFEAYVYNHPGPPTYIQNSNEDGIDDPYKWNFALVASWSSHLDPDDQTMVDISPASIGNYDLESFNDTFQGYKDFYDFMEGGGTSSGRAINPKTGAAYQPQIIKRSDYTRVLAEFWADGPDSETPPGHWFTILNYVNDQPEVVKKIGGQGAILDNLEWDVKSYLTLGGAMHDTAVNIWGIKGYYDFIRPVSAIRYMAGKGQSSDASQPSYDPHGMPLIPGRIELIAAGDPLAGNSNENVGKIKIKAWKGPDYIDNPETDVAGVDWILGSHWWPYQRPTFVTPPFAGYLSGHSSFSRAAAEVLTKLTGDPYFPGGMGTFHVEKNDFLVFEDGPTESFTLQWATYQDASDQTSLSRIWGGIHPPIDDMRGRIIGKKIGIEAFAMAKTYFDGTATLGTDSYTASKIQLYPNPFRNELKIKNGYNQNLTVDIYALDGKFVKSAEINETINSISLNSLSTGMYLAKFHNRDNSISFAKQIVKM